MATDVHSSRHDHADRRLVLQFLAGGVVVALVLGIGSALLLRDAARAEAERSARRSTELTARAVVEPALTTGVLRREPAAVERFDQLVRARIMDATTVRVKLWSADGTVVYSDQSQLLGRTFGLDGEEREVIRDGGTVSEVTDLDRPENRADRGFDRLLEVYTRVEAADGTPLLYETYVRDEAVSRSGRALWGRILPTAVGALLLLELVQVPLALRLARRFGDRRRERERLLQAAVDSSELERRRIARDLHDGVVQHLAGVGLHLHAASVDPTVDAAGAAELMGSSAADVRQAIRELRTLLVDIYPPNLRELGLTQALEDLVSELPARGIKPRLEVQDVEHLEPRIEQLLYRVAQEAVRNAERHSGATQVTLEVGGRGPAIGLCVTDDGAGFDTTRAPADGHVGLLLLRDLVAASGGRLHVRSTPGNGTVVDLELDTDRA